MNQTRIQQWLDSVCSAFDYNMLYFLHYFAEKTHGALTDVCKVIGILSENGILLLISGIILFCFRRTRKLGFCLSGAVCCSAFITLLLKDVIARPRPFVDTTSIYHDWWQFIALPAESGFAFPSGHTTVAMAAAVAIFLNVNTLSVRYSGRDNYRHTRSSSCLSHFSSIFHSLEQVFTSKIE